MLPLDIIKYNILPYCQSQEQFTISKTNMELYLFIYEQIEKKLQNMSINEIINITKCKKLHEKHCVKIMNRFFHHTFDPFNFRKREKKKICKNIFKYQKLSEHFIHYYSSFLDEKYTYLIWMQHHISEDFLGIFIKRKSNYIKEYDWFNLCRLRKLSENFLLEHREYIKDWNFIFYRDDISNDFLLLLLDYGIIKHCINWWYNYLPSNILMLYINKNIEYFNRIKKNDPILVAKIFDKLKSSNIEIPKSLYKRK
jgi:hypothetical protein